MAERVNNIVTKIQEKGKSNSMELIFFPLIFLVFLGVIVNNAQANNLQTVPVISGYPCTLGVGNCSLIAYPSNPTGCVASINNCNISKVTTISFLNQNSPFTYLISGNIVGFLSSIFNQGETLNTYQIAETICVPVANGKMVNSTALNISNFRCFGNVQYNYVQSPSVFPPLNATSNYGNNSIWNIVGCANINNTCNLNLGQSAQATFYGIYVKNSTTLTATHGCTLYGSTALCEAYFPFLFGTNPAFTCPNTAHIAGININATTYYCILPTNNPATFSVANSFSFFAVIAGAILMVMGFGLNFAFSILTNGGTLGINPQGTKLAQVIGIGLVVWGFIFSEFGSILLTLPLNLGAIAVTALTVIFFMGLYWRMFSLD